MGISAFIAECRFKEKFQAQGPAVDTIVCASMNVHSTAPHRGQLNHLYARKSRRGGTIEESSGVEGEVQVRGGKDDFGLRMLRHICEC